MKPIESYSQEVIAEAKKGLSEMHFHGDIAKYSRLSKEEQRNLLRIACHSIELRELQKQVRQNLAGQVFTGESGEQAIFEDLPEEEQKEMVRKAASDLLARQEATGNI